MTTQSTVTLLELANPYCLLKVAPEIGGRIVSWQWRATGEELLWHNSAVSLRPCAPGTEYDPNFYGGIDELLPCDVPESIDGVACADHGELWTTPLHAECTGNALVLRGTMPRFGLGYERHMTLAADRPELVCQYRISNLTEAPRHFLWKLHAALAVQPGDVIDCPAQWAQAVDPVYTTCPTMAPFHWPMLGEEDKSIISPANGSCEFLYLYELSEGRMAWRSVARKLSFTYYFDTAVFPYAWLFQSFGGFDGHYTTVLEPCTSMPLRVNDAAALEQCSVLAPGEVLCTMVRTVIGGREQ